MGTIYILSPYFLYFFNMPDLDINHIITNFVLYFSKGNTLEYSLRWHFTLIVNKS